MSLSEQRAMTIDFAQARVAATASELASESY